MNSFKLTQHNVKSASFFENMEKETKKDIAITVEGGVLIPKNLKETKYLIVQLKVELGKTDEYLFLSLETISKFEIESNYVDNKISEEDVQRECFPIALSELRKTVRNVTAAYGIPVIDLPPFEDEINN